MPAYIERQAGLEVKFSYRCRQLEGNWWHVECQFGTDRKI